MTLGGLAAVRARECIVVAWGVLTAGCGIFLLALGDAHGSAVVGGLVIGVLVGAISPPRITSASAARATRVDAR
jgi:hypothetical protein